MVRGMGTSSQPGHDANPADTLSATGRVTAVRGAVLDVRVGDVLPAIHDAVMIGAGENSIPAEVQAHLDAHHVRVIALAPTEGVARGALVRLSGGPLCVPVGPAVLGRLLDVKGALGDDGPPLPAEVPRRPAIGYTDGRCRGVFDRHQDP